jgi:DNA-directed RNA polymerase specialized sigma subunit
VFGVTTSRICQLHGRAIARLRAELEADGALEAA